MFARVCRAEQVRCERARSRAGARGEGQLLRKGAVLRSSPLDSLRVARTLRDAVRPVFKSPRAEDCSVVQVLVVIPFCREFLERLHVALLLLSLAAHPGARLFHDDFAPLFEAHGRRPVGANVCRGQGEGREL